MKQKNFQMRVVWAAQRSPGKSRLNRMRHCPKTNKQTHKNDTTQRSKSPLPRPKPKETRRTGSSNLVGRSGSSQGPAASCEPPPALPLLTLRLSCSRGRTLTPHFLKKECVTGEKTESMWKSCLSRSGRDQVCQRTRFCMLAFIFFRQALTVFEAPVCRERMLTDTFLLPASCPPASSFYP